MLLVTNFLLLRQGETIKMKMNHGMINILNA